MRQNPVRIALRNRQMAHGIMATEFLTPGLCQILANAGAEYVIFDMEHGGMGIDGFAPSPFRMSNTLMASIRGLLAPYLNPSAMVG